MKIRKRYLIGALLIIACLVAAALTKAQAQSGAGYDLTWNTQESGGRLEASGGSYSLYGSLGAAGCGRSLERRGIFPGRRVLERYTRLPNQLAGGFKVKRWSLIKSTPRLSRTSAVPERDRE